MIHPSYTELIEAINRGGEEEGEADMVLNSRYSLVLATSKRARQLIAGAKPLVKGASGKKPLSVAIEELYQGKVKILPPKEEEETQAVEERPSMEGYRAYFDTSLDDGEGYDEENRGDGEGDDEEREEDSYTYKDMELEHSYLPRTGEEDEDQ